MRRFFLVFVGLVLMAPSMGLATERGDKLLALVQKIVDRDSANLTPEQRQIRINASQARERLDALTQKLARLKASLPQLRKNSEEARTVLAAARSADRKAALTAYAAAKTQLHNYPLNTKRLVDDIADARAALDKAQSELSRPTTASFPLTPMELEAAQLPEIVMAREKIFSVEEFAGVMGDKYAALLDEIEMEVDGPSARAKDQVVRDLLVTLIATLASIDAAAAAYHSRFLDRFRWENKQNLPRNVALLPLALLSRPFFQENSRTPDGTALGKLRSIGFVALVSARAALWDANRYWKQNPSETIAESVSRYFVHVGDYLAPLHVNWDHVEIVGGMGVLGAIAGYFSIGTYNELLAPQIEKTRVRLADKARTSNALSAFVKAVESHGHRFPGSRWYSLASGRYQALANHLDTLVKEHGIADCANALVAATPATTAITPVDQSVAVDEGVAEDVRSYVNGNKIYE